MDTSGNKGERLMIRVSLQEKMEMKQLAAAQKVSLSKYLRSAALPKTK